LKLITIFFVALIFCSFWGKAQNPDSVKIQELSPITIESEIFKSDIQRISPMQGAYIFSGKKNEQIWVTLTDANITEKIGRQLFAKVPGVFVYDLEGSNQMNIATRGLDPHRGWEFNNRKDGVLINSDLYGYPAAHYSIPMESVERIELVRGLGALQYGAQLGGMLNYVTKQGDSSKVIGFESFNAIGSFNLLSSYNAIGGKIKKLRYYAYYITRSREGYRKNEATQYDAQGLYAEYQPSDNLTLRMEWVRSNYIYKIPGPLTDAMFYQDPKQATRFRNYYSPTIHIPSFTLKWKASPQTQIQFVSSAIIGERKSVIYDRPANIADTIKATTLQYNNRQVDIDRFNSFTQELRVLQNYNFRKNKSALVIGIQSINNHMYRTQLGKGTTGWDYDLTLVDPNWGRDLHFKTNNIAVFAENSLQLTPRLTLNAGARYEKGESKLTGKILYYPENELPVSIQRNFILGGASFSYKPWEHSEFYGGFSQAYRPMLLKDITPSSVFEKVDPTIKDATGYNAEIGYRGSYKFLQWDITAFILQYNNRFGMLALTDANGNFYAYRTNIGNSSVQGLEIFLQGGWYLGRKSKIIAFTSTSFMDGRYTSGSLRAGNINVELKGKKIESAPGVLTRNGLTYQYKQVSATLLLSHTSQTFADPLNTQQPNATGTVGLVPAYTLLDFNATLRISKALEVRISLNNLTNRQYFTKRPLFYPGPGVWPSDGRNATLSFLLKI
jgi:Fe(3+) dicitrate transport protein